MILTVHLARYSVVIVIFQTTVKPAIFGSSIHTISTSNRIAYRTGIAMRIRSHRQVSLGRHPRSGYYVSTTRPGTLAETNIAVRLETPACAGILRRPYTGLPNQSIPTTISAISCLM